LCLEVTFVKRLEFQIGQFFSLTDQSNNEFNLNQANFSLPRAKSTKRTLFYRQVLILISPGFIPLKVPAPEATEQFQTH
jgi:hypothetical protein